MTFYSAPHILYRDRFHDPLTAPNSFEQFKLNFDDIDFQNIDMYLQNIYNIGFTVCSPYTILANKRYKSKSISDNFYRLFQYLVVFTDEFGH